MRVIKAPSIEQEPIQEHPLPSYLGFAPLQNSHRKIALPTMEGIHFEPVQQIISLEANGNYTLMRFEDGHQLLVCKTLRGMELLLNDTIQFVRIHRSFTINLSKLKKYIKGKGGSVIMENGEQISVSVGKKQAFLNALKMYFG